MGSGTSKGSRKSYAHYDPSQDLDPAFLASTEDLRFSPNTQANTMANTNSRMSAYGGNSPALSYLDVPR